MHVAVPHLSQELPPIQDAVPQSSQELPPIQDAIDHYTPYINYTKLLFKVLKLLQTLFLGCKLLNDFSNKFSSIF